MFEVRKRDVFGGDVIYKSETATCLNEALTEFLKSLNGSRANLYGANLSRTDLCDADLYGADLYGANLRGANLRDAYLCCANLRGADLCDANLYGANLYGADLCGANLRGANLRDAYLRGADLSCANLRGADLSCANLRRADLYGADLYGAKLSWSSHVIISTLLKNAANKEIAKLEVAGLISIMNEWCWSEFCALDKPAEINDWAMRTLSGWAWSDDGSVPNQLVQWCIDNGVERKPWPGGAKTELEGK